MTTTEHPCRPLHFSVQRGDNDTSALRYGADYYSLGLPDGREVMLHADRVEVDPTGTLLVWSDAIHPGLAGRIEKANSG